MTERTPPTIDMRLDGSFQQPARHGLPLSFKLMVGAAVLTLIGGSIAVAAFALWVLSMMLPVIIGAGLFAWAMLTYRRWRASRGGASLRPF